MADRLWSNRVYRTAETLTRQLKKSNAAQCGAIHIYMKEVYFYRRDIIRGGELQFD